MHEEMHTYKQPEDTPAAGTEQSSIQIWIGGLRHIVSIDGYAAIFFFMYV